MFLVSIRCWLIPMSEQTACAARAHIVAAARECVGVPFRLQGRDPALGLDCIGLVLHAGRAAGFPLFDAPDYRLSEDPVRLDAAMEQAGMRRILLREYQIGDCLRFVTGGEPLHLGITTGDGIIHADLRFRRVVEHDLDNDWQQRLVAAYQFPFGK